MFAAFAGVILAAAVIGLYLVAPCWIFGGWGKASFFFGAVWPALITVVAGLVVLSFWKATRGGSIWWIWSGWTVVTGVVMYGWYTGYLTTYMWWISTAGAPWPKFC